MMVMYYFCPAGVCTSVLKKICRDNGLIRWPYRKVSLGHQNMLLMFDAFVFTVANSWCYSIIGTQ